MVVVVVVVDARAKGAHCAPGNDGTMESERVRYTFCTVPLLQKTVRYRYEYSASINRSPEFRIEILIITTTPTFYLFLFYP